MKTTRNWLALTGALLLWLGLTAGWRPLHLPDEARYVGVAWEMVRSGDWLTPTLNAAPFFHKPPLFYWLTAAALDLGGVNEWSARLAPLLAATASALVLWWFTRRWAADKTAGHTLLALASQPLFFLAAQYANLDILVSSGITITVLLAAHSALSIEDGRAAPVALTLAYGVAGLSVLAKGLIGLALPGLVIVSWLLARSQWRVLLKLIWWPGLLLFAAVTAPWFLAMQSRHPEFLHYFFVVHHLRRYAAEGFNNVQPWYFYPAVLAVCTLPLWPFLWRAASRTQWSARGTSGSVRQLMWCWLLAITVFFSIPQSKPLGYILPVVAPLAFLAADAFTTWSERHPRPRGVIGVWWMGLAISAAVALGSVAYFATHSDKSQRALGWALGQRIQATEQVVALHRFPYDVPLYARLPGPMVVIENWQDPDIQRSDSWPKELQEAARFQRTGEPRWLIQPSELVGRLCRRRISWITGHPSEVQRYPWLVQAENAYSDSNSTLWRLDRDVLAAQGLLHCPSP